MRTKRKDALPADLVSGIDFIDDQHRELFERVNHLQSISLTSRSPENAAFKAKSHLTFLRDYIVIHFHDEEEMMEREGYPHLPLHKKSHKKLCAWVEEMGEKFAAHPTKDFLVEMNFAMVDWLTRHIKGEDKKFCTFMAAISMRQPR